jgi:hypothetical protein
VVQRHDLRHGDGKRMTLITFQDGKPLMKDDGKIGTEQECCCEEGCERCESPIPEACEIDYVAVTIEFRFNNCGNGLGTTTLILNEANGFDNIDQNVLDENGNLFFVDSQLICQSGDSFDYNINWRIAARFQNCGLICDPPVQFVAGIGRGFALNKRRYNGACCPVAIDSYVWDGEDGACPGAYIAVTNISIVLL